MIAKIESGSRRVDALELARLASALAVPMGHLLQPAPAVLSRRAVALTEDTETEVGRESNLLDTALQGWIAELRQLVEVGTLAPRPIMRYPADVASTGDARRAAHWVRARLSHFARADRLDVLRDLLLGRHCWMTTVVRDELTVGAARYARIREALALDWLQVANLDSLDELRCFVKWAQRLGSGDRDATRVARRYGADVHGTIWLLGTACQSGKLTLVGAGNLVDALRAEGARLPCTGTEFPAFARHHGLLSPDHR